MEMKYFVMLCDGMADYPIAALDNKTPMAVAKKPNMDALAQKALVGKVRTVPPTMKPGSDVANLAAMGFDPESCYTGRSPLEAMSIGIDMKETDIAFRCNLVTLSDEAVYGEKTMVDYSSQEISTEEAAQLIAADNKAFADEEISFYAGISYRHCMIWHEGPNGLNLTPPHDISDRVIGPYLPQNPKILALMEKSYDILKDHPVNQARVAKGLRPANSIWLWGEGTRPAVPKFMDLFGLTGSVISAVDLIKGIGICTGFDVIEVEGATGNIHTNFANKGKAALEEFQNGKDYVYVHVEAPDECGHQGEMENKILSIELIDRDILGPVVKGLQEIGEPFSVLVMPDHPTPLSTTTHAMDPVPFLIYRSNEEKEGVSTINEETAEATGVFFESGVLLGREFLKDALAKKQSS